MAFRRTTTTAEPEPDGDAIRPLDAHPRYAALVAMRRNLVAARHSRENALELLALEAEFARPTTSSSGPRIAALRERAALLRAAAPEPKHEEVPNPENLPLPTLHALKLMQGNAAVEEPPDRQKKVERLRTELRILESGIGPVDLAMEEIRAEESLRVAMELQPQHQAILRTIWECCAQLSAAVDAERDHYASVLLAGFEGRPDVMRRPGLRALGLLGSRREYDSEVSTFERRLREWGVLP